MSRLGAALSLLLLTLTGVTAVTPASASTLRLSDDHGFAIELVGDDGRVEAATVRGSGGVPVRVPGADGPLPVEPFGAAGAFPALGWVLGARGGLTFPVSFFSGNRLFGAEAGGVVAVTGVRPTGGGTFALDTTAGVAGRARVDGTHIEIEAPPELPIVSTMFTLASPEGEGLYGLGGRKDAFDQRGRLRNVWVEQQNLSDERLDGVGSAIEPQYTFPNGAQAAYFVVPALVGSRGWAAWVDGTALQRLDLASSRSDAVRWGVASPRIGLTLAGGGIEKASRAYTEREGRAPAPPRWVYEPQIDVLNEGEGEAAPNGARFDGGPRVKRDIDEIVAQSKRHGLPIGVIGIEGWHKVLDEEGPKAKAYFLGLRKQGFHLSAYWNPFTAQQGKGYAAASAAGLFVKDAATGRPYTLITNRNNPANLIDFTQPGAREFWKTQLDRHADLGFEGFMEDFGELITDGMTQADDVPAQFAHNAYPVHYHRAGRWAIEEQRRERGSSYEPWFYVRSGHTGVPGATSGVFPGDESTDWSAASGIGSVVPAMLNLTLTGSGAFTTDVGGYLDIIAPRTTPELFTRWAQLASFTAISRIHNSTGKTSLFPWEAGDAALDAYRRYSRAKLRLIDLVDRWSRRAATDGTVGPVRPLVLSDPSLRSVKDAWTLGRDILIAPVLKPGAASRQVPLPAGERWQQVRIGAAGEFIAVGPVRPGGQRVDVRTPLADIPIFLRQVDVRLVRRCVDDGRLRVALDGDVSSVLGAELRRGARQLTRRLATRPLLVSRAALARGRGVLRARVRLEDGRVVRLKRTTPACRTPRPPGGLPAPAARPW